MSKIALVSPPWKKDYMRNARCDFVSLSNSSWFPIWLGSAGAALEGRGHETFLFDAQVLGLTFAQATAETFAQNPDVVCVYTGRLSEDSDIEFADQFAKKGITTVLVGPYFSINPQATLKKCRHTKIGIQREFDLPLAELLESHDVSANDNFLFREDGEVKTNKIRPLYKTEVLDSFPITSKYFHEQLNIYKYKTPSELYPFLDVLSGRGCAWGKCNFCLWVQTFVPGTVYNLRSIEHFGEEFRYIKQKMPFIKSVMIQDDMLTNKRADEIAEFLLQNSLVMPWSCYAKPNSKLTQDTLLKMKRSGCLNLHVGFESGDDEVLEKIDKGSNIDQAVELAEMAHKAGLQLHGDFAVGHYGDTIETMEKTVALAKKINPHTAQFQVMIPFKGTKFWQQLEEKNLWSETGEPSYEKINGASAEEIREFAKKAYRSFYLSPQYLKKVIADPKNYFFNRFDQYCKAIPALFWKKWIK